MRIGRWGKQKSREPGGSGAGVDVAVADVPAPRAVPSPPAGPTVESHPLAAEALADVSSVRVGLQGIHDADRAVVGYELLFRAPGTDSTALESPEEHDRATAHVITSTFGEFGVEEMADGKLLFLNTARSFITGRLPLPFPPEGVVLELLETVDVDAELMTGLRALRERGYTIAVDDFDGETWRVPSLLEADYVKIDAQATGRRLPEVVNMVREVRPSATIIVKRVESQRQFDHCRTLGVEMFQGYLLHRPVVVQRQTLTSTHLTCVRLLAALHDLSTPVEEVLDLLAHDAALSMRILKTVGSAAHAPTAGITSLQQAVVMLGRRELASWVTLILLSGTTTGEGSDQESITKIFTRAEACRLLVPEDADTAFTVGLLSGAAEVLGVGPDELLRGVAIAPSISSALIEGKGAVGSALHAVTSHEDAFADEDETHASPAGPADGGQQPAAPTPGANVSMSYFRALGRARATVGRLLGR